MCEQGWVLLQADAGDQRRTLVAATAKGRRLVKPLVNKARSHEAQLMQTLSSSESATLKKLLGKLAGLG